jgi:hypothetical protein
MTSKRTVQFEFLIDADARQIDKFHDSLKRLQQTGPVSEQVLTSLRKELERFSNTNAKTENSLQGQIGALRDASKNADLTAKEYGKLRQAARELGAEFERLTALESDMLKGQGSVLGSKNSLQEEIAYWQQKSAGMKASGAEYDQIIGKVRQLSTEQARLNSLNSENLKGQSTVLGSENYYRQRIAGLREEASAVDMTAAEYRKLQRQIQSLEKDQQKRQVSHRSGKLREMGQVAQQAAIGGFFGGPEGLLGSMVGASIGSTLGPGGMLAGAQAGASVGLAAQQLRMSAAGVAELSAQLNLAKTTLAQVSVNQGDYNQKLSFARQVSTDYTVGLQDTIQGYARVTAAAAANGLTLDQTQKIYKGMIASGIAFGASQDDIKGIILATTQVLSKGKISAEEVNQIAERVPGTFVKLAQATGRSTAQLSSDLQQGTVKIGDFVKFADSQFKEYDGAAKLIGSGPEKAGQRLELALTRMNELYGNFFTQIGAWFQDNATGVINWLNSNKSGIETFVGLVKWAAKEISSIQVLNPFSGIGGIFNKADLGVFKPSADSVIGSALTPFFKDRQKEGQSVLSGGGPTRFGNAPPAPIQSDLFDDKARKKAEAEARRQQAAFDRERAMQEQLASEARKQQEVIANNAIKLADRVFEHQQNLARKQHDLELSLIEATARAREASLVAPAREGAAIGNRLDAIIRAAREEIRSNAEAVAAGKQAIKSAQETAKIREKYMAMPPSAVGAPVYWDRSSNSTGGGATGKIVSIGGGHSLDSSAAGAFRKMVADAAREGVTISLTSSYRSNAEQAVLYQRYLNGTGNLAAQPGKSGHNRGTSLDVRSGISWMQRNGARYGWANTGMSFSQPEPWHFDYKGGGQSPSSSPTPSSPTLPGEQSRRTAAGVASGRTQYLTDKGDIDLAKENQKNIEKQQQLLKTKQPAILEKQLQAELLASTEAYRQETQSIKDQQQELKDRNRLRMEGVKPEIIDQQIKLNQESLRFNRIIEQQKEELKTINDPELLAIRTEAIKMQTNAYAEQLAAQEELNRSINDKRYTFDLKDSARSGIDGYIESIGTLNEAVTNLTQKGFGGISGALKDLMTTGSADFRTFAVNMLTDTTEIIIQQMVVAQLAQVIRGFLGGAAGGGGGAGIGGQFNVADWSGVASYAGGGHTGNAPRSGGLDGKGGFVAMLHPRETVIDHAGYTPISGGTRNGAGGGHTVNVSIDATGTSAAGDLGRSQQFASAVENGVMAIFVREKRPGGSLYEPGR